MSEQSIDYQLGALAARTTQVEARQAMLEASIDRRLEKLEQRVGAVHDAITSGRGGGKAVLLLLSAAATLSGAVGWLIHLVWPK